MKNFLLGYGAGILTYHYISGGFKNDELVSEMRSMIKKLDDRLAEAEKPQNSETVSTPPERPPTTTGDPSVAYRRMDKETE